MTPEPVSRLLDMKAALLAAAEAAEPDQLSYVIAQAEEMFGYAMGHGLAPFALDALEIALRMPDVSREPWVELDARYDRLRREIAEHSQDVELRTALADFHQGMTAAARVRPETESLLATAYPVLRKYPGAATKSECCRQALEMILLANDPERITLGLDPDSPPAEPDRLVSGALALANDGKVTEAMAWLAAASRAAAQAGDRDEALVIDGYRAAMALRADPTGLALRLAAVTLAALDDRLAGPQPVRAELPDLAQHLRAELSRYA